MSSSKRRGLGDARVMAEVRSRVWRWDPVGLAGLGGPEDEYDCLIAPITSWLITETPPRYLAERLESEIAQHFGVGRPGDARQFADDLTVWYAEVDPSRDIHRR